MKGVYPQAPTSWALVGWGWDFIGKETIIGGRWEMKVYSKLPRLLNAFAKKLLEGVDQPLPYLDG